MHIHITLPIAAVMVGVSFTGASTWVRRGTWQSQWENLTTLQVVLQAVALILVSTPAADTLGVLLHDLTGLWHLNTMIGQCCYIVAAATILACVLRRIADDEQAAEAAAVFINPVVTLAIPLACCAFILSDSPRGTFYANVFKLPNDFWLSTYWLIISGTVAYLLAYAIRAFRVARRDPRHRLACDMRIGAMCFGIAACAACALQAVVPMLDALDYRGLTIWVCASAGAVIFALSTAYSWRTAMEPARAFQRATRQADPPTGPKLNPAAPPL